MMLVGRTCTQRVGTTGRLELTLTIVVTLSLVVAGCGGKSGHAPTVNENVVAPSRYNAALARPRTELEADGLPVQSPPLSRRVRFPDDPDEPYSRNYGSSLSVGLQPGTSSRQEQSGQDKASLRNNINTLRISQQDLPEDLPPDFRERIIVEQHLR